MSTPPTFRLASTSATRRSLLAATGLVFDAAKPPVDEAMLKTNMADATVAQVAAALAQAKALSLSPGDDDTLVIGADQTLDLDGQLFDKPVSEQDARRQLQQLRGKTHHLHSAVACAQRGAMIWSSIASAHLTMRNFSDAELETYISQMGARLLTSVGGYQIEALGITLFEKIEGDYFTILGLPMLPLLAFLRQQGFKLP